MRSIYNSLCYHYPYRTILCSATLKADHFGCSHNNKKRQGFQPCRFASNYTIFQMEFQYADFVPFFYKTISRALPAKQQYAIRQA